MQIDRQNLLEWFDSAIKKFNLASKKDKSDG